MYSISKIITTLAIIGTSVVHGSNQSSRELDKTVLDKPLDPADYHISQRMLHQLQSSPPNITQVSPKIKICYDCQDKFVALGYNYTETMELYNVTFQDRALDNVPPQRGANLVNVTAYMSRVPLNMRKYIRHIITLPSMKPNSSSHLCLDGTVEHNEGNLILYGRVSMQTLLAGAARASADAAFLSQPSNRTAPIHFWESKAWLDAYAKDTALVNKFAQLSQEENFKQITAVAVFDAQFWLGLRMGNVVGEWKKFENMLGAIERNARSGMLQKSDASSCEGKVSDERPGRME